MTTAAYYQSAYSHGVVWDGELPQELAKQEHGPQPVPDEAAGKVGASCSLRVRF